MVSCAWWALATDARPWPLFKRFQRVEIISLQLTGNNMRGYFERYFPGPLTGPHSSQDASMWWLISPLVRVNNADGPQIPYHSSDMCLTRNGNLDIGAGVNWPRNPQNHPCNTAGAGAVQHASPYILQVPSAMGVAQRIFTIGQPTNPQSILIAQHGLQMNPMNIAGPLVGNFAPLQAAGRPQGAFPPWLPLRFWCSIAVSATRAATRGS